MPGHGTKWNEEISKDWGGQVMKDYLSAIDEVSKEKFVDKDRRGCVGASYGGYSVFMLAGMHNNRFKTFIAHDGTFDLKAGMEQLKNCGLPIGISVDLIGIRRMRPRKIVI